MYDSDENYWNHSTSEAEDEQFFENSELNHWNRKDMEEDEVGSEEDLMGKFLMMLHKSFR